MFSESQSTFAKLYLAHSITAITLFLLEVRSCTRPILTDSSFGVFVDRTRSIIRYMLVSFLYISKHSINSQFNMLRVYRWPKEQFRVHLQIIGCFALIIAGRVINLLSPLFAKWIGM